MNDNESLVNQSSPAKVSQKYTKPLDQESNKTNQTEIKHAQKVIGNEKVTYDEMMELLKKVGYNQVDSGNIMNLTEKIIESK